MTNKYINYLKKNKLSLLVLIICFILFLFGYFLLKPESNHDELSGDYAEYENAKVVEILTDSTIEDSIAENALRGEQMLLVEVSSGQYQGDTLQVFNYIGPLYGSSLKIGDSCTLVISTYENGDIRASVYEYNRRLPLLIILSLFCLTTIIVGGKNGLKSLAGLAITAATLFFLYFPALLKGAPILPTTLLATSYIALVSFIILGGIQKKTICAFIGTVCGMLFALLFALLAQYLLRIDGLRASDVEPLLHLRQTGTPIHIRGLLSAGVIISALGAVMDVAMSISSSLQELHLANPNLNEKELWKSGMNIGKDLVGTMTNTLILAFLGSSLILILYLYTLSLSPNQLLSSSYLAIEAISGISSSIGVILSVPLTAFIAALTIGKQNKA